MNASNRRIDPATGGLWTAKGWEKEWNDTLEGAKKEGKVVVATAPDPVMREIAAKFKARYAIMLEHLAGSSSQLAGRLGTERRAGINSVDVFLAGIQTVANILYPEKMLDPIKPALILAEVTDPKKWKTGKPWFIDPAVSVPVESAEIEVPPQISLDSTEIALRWCSDRGAETEKVEIQRHYLQ